MQRFEKLILITADGLGRASVVRRDDGHFELYVAWLWNEETRLAFNVADSYPKSWKETAPADASFFEEISPEPSLFDSLESALKHLRSMSGFHGPLELLTNSGEK